MGTIDISYFNLLIGLLLLVIPLFYLWKFKTGLLKATLIGTARMIVQLFLIGMYLKYLFQWNNPWINFLWVIIMIFVAGQTALVRTGLKREILLIPISVGFLCSVVLVGMYFIGIVLQRIGRADSTDRACGQGTFRYGKSDREGNQTVWCP